MKFDNAHIKRKKPILRNGFFMSDKQFDFQTGIAAEYINKMINQTVILYEVDLENTNINTTYNEADFNNIAFKTPIELNVMYKLDKAELKTYDTQAIKGYYVKVGKLSFQVMLKELEENKCDIKRGDYIGLQVNPEHMEYFIVADDGRINFDNAHTLWGTKPYFRTITCTTVSDVKETVNL